MLLFIRELIIILSADRLRLIEIEICFAYVGPSAPTQLSVDHNSKAISIHAHDPFLLSLRR